MWRYLWAAPNSLLGLLLGGIALAGGASLRRIDGTLEIGGGFFGRCCARMPRALRFSAITLGHVIVGQDPRVLACARAHEQVHVRQYERWGPLFLPLYLGSSLLQLVRGRHPYYDNAFEAEAYRLDACPHDDRAA